LRVLLQETIKLAAAGTYPKTQKVIALHAAQA
jgi:hypothetical protein